MGVSYNVVMDAHHPQRRLWPFVVAAAAAGAIAFATAGAAASDDGSSSSGGQQRPDTVTVQQRQQDRDTVRDHRDCPFEDGGRQGQPTLFEQS